jgi:small subunit ribosomal protein S13
LAQEFRHIVRIAGTDLEGALKLEYGLARIKGLGVNLSKAVVKRSNINGDQRIGDLTDTDVQKVEDVLRNPRKYEVPDWLLNRRKDIDTGEDLHLIGPDLTLRLKTDIDNMKQIRSWKGTRHSLGLKVRGQRTKTSARTGRAVGVKKKALIEAQAKEGEK